MTAPGPTRRAAVRAPGMEGLIAEPADMAPKETTLAGILHLAAIAGGILNRAAIADGIRIHTTSTQISSAVGVFTGTRLAGEVNN